MSLANNCNYSPPYDSELENLFAWNLDKYLADEAVVSKQVEVNTICGRFRLDFIVQTLKHPLVAFECDGADYHDEPRDEWRDAMILGTERVSVIYRLKGSSLFHHMEDCLYFLSLWEKSVFSQRGRINLKQLASQTARNAAERLDFAGVLVPYFHSARCAAPYLLNIERHVINAPPGKRTFLRHAFDYAKSLGISDLDEVMTRHNASVATI